MPGHSRGRRKQDRPGWLSRFSRWPSLFSQWLDRQAQVEARRRLSPAPAIPPTNRRRTNRRFVGVSSVLLVLAISVAYANWRWQRQGVAHSLRAHAERLAAQGDWPQAAARYQQYAAIVPEDSAVRFALAAAVDQSAGDVARRQRAAELYQQALRESPELHPAERCRLAELWLSLGRDANALLELEGVLAAEPLHPDACRIRALTLFRGVANGRREASDEVAQSLETAGTLNPGDPQLALARATWLHEFGQTGTPADRAKQAEGVLNDLVANAPTAPAAWLQRHVYRVRYRLPRAEDDLAQARRRGPTDPEVLLASGEQVLRSGDVPGALAEFQQVVAQAPQDRRGYLGWALCAERLGDRDSAIAACRQGLAGVGQRDPWLQLRLAECLVGTEAALEVPARLRAVEAHLRESAPNLPHSAARAWRHAIQLIQGRWHLAREEFGPAAEIFAKLFVAGDEGLAATDQVRLRVELAYLRAVCHSGLEQWTSAAEAFQDAWRLEPERADHLLAAGKAWERAVRWRRAAECYEQAAAIASDPTLAESLLAKLPTRPEATPGATTP